MKLLYILSEYLPDSGGGIITHYSRMLPQLVRRGNSVKVILASAGKLDQPTYEIDGVCVEPLRSEFLEKYKGCFERWAGLDVFYYMLPVAWAAWAQAQENFDYDLVEATDWALLFAPWVASPKKAPVVISLHGSCGQVDWYSHTGGERSLAGDLVRMAEVVSLRGADAIHANSRMNAEFWRARTGCEVTVIPPASAGGGSLYRKLTTEDTETTELVQGSFQPRIARMGTDEGKAESGNAEKLKLNFERFEEEAGLCLASQAGASEPDSLTSKLADSPVSESLTRPASGPASAALCADEGRSWQGSLESASLAGAGDSRSEWSGVFEGPSSSLLGSGSAKTPPAQALGVPASASSFRVVREFRGEISEGSKHVPCSATAPEARGLVVGRLQNWKGAEVLCQALRLVPNIRVEWVGADTNWDGRGTMASEYLSRTYPDVWGSRLVWLGQMDRGEVAKKIRGAAFLVIPSLWDVFNLTVAEGLEAGVAVVCSRGAGAEMLIEQFKSGFLFESGDAEGLAGCLQQVIGMDAATRAEMVSHAQANVPRIMDSNRILEMVESSYIATVKMGFCPMADEWLKNLFAPGPRQPAPAPAGLVKRVIRKAGRFLSNV